MTDSIGEDAVIIIVDLVISSSLLLLVNESIFFRKLQF